jgi:hypothetical protein
VSVTTNNDSYKVAGEKRYESINRLSKKKILYLLPVKKLKTRT